MPKKKNDLNTQEDVKMQETELENADLENSESVITDSDSLDESTEVQKMGKELLDKVAKSEEKASEEESEMEDLFERASKRKKRKLYRSERIIPIDDELEIETASDKRKETYLEIAASYRGGKVLTGIIAGCIAPENEVPCAKVLLGEWIIAIPINELSDNITEDILSKPSLGRLLISKRIGSEIQFVITGANESQMIASASRVEALRQVRTAYYWTKDRDTGRYALNEGDLVEGRVQYLNSYGVGVEVFGVERVIPASECLHHRGNLVEYFAPGDRVPVKIIELSREVKNGTRELTLNVSIKQALPNPREIYFNQYDEGETYLATVTWVDDKGIFVMLNDKVEARCYFAAGEMRVPAIGDKLAVKIQRKFEDTKMINCEIIKQFPKKRSLYY